ncbi:MAG TPA: alpha/beta hydrolase [Steroidobacteraceae bacterium]|jgi:fermentation-respiration switch protein FrsA (DUF1100 family)|nr:alpha/beta hydrolase [Steroidobacteraceae bacterium]
MSSLLYLGGILVATSGLICACSVAENHLLYYPTPEVARTGARAVRIECAGATLKIWELHPDRDAALLYFGGNAEDVGANLGDFDTVFADRAVYLVNYRGYGGSTGRPSEAALTADAATVYDSLRSRHARIAVIGRSLGSGVAVALASERPVERLILITPFDSIANVAADHFRPFPVRLLVRDRYDSARRIGRVSAPTLVVVAEHDEVVWRARSDALFAAITPSLRYTLLVPGATHNDVSSSPIYYPSLREFLYPALPSR